MNRINNQLSKEPKRQISIKIDGSTIDYFKDLSLEVGVPYQTLMNLYLRDCATKKRGFQMTWK